MFTLTDLLRHIDGHAEVADKERLIQVALEDLRRAKIQLWTLLHYLKNPREPLVNKESWIARKEKEEMLERYPQTPLQLIQPPASPSFCESAENSPRGPFQEPLVMSPIRRIPSYEEI